MTKLTPEQVREARRRKMQGETIKAVAVDMGIKYTTLHRAVTGRTWKHLDDPGPVEMPPARGRHHHKAKLSPAQVREARRRAAEGEPIAQIARDYPGTTPAVYFAVRGFSWKHIEEPPPVKGKHYQQDGQSESPCKRCKMLCSGRYCRLCVAEGYAPPYLAAEVAGRADPHMGVV